MKKTSLLLLTLALPASAQTKPAAPPTKSPVAKAPAPSDGKAAAPARPTRGKPDPKSPTKPGETSAPAGKPGDKTTPPAKPNGAKPDAKPSAPEKPVFVRPKYPLGAVTALTFSPDGKRLALGTFGQVVLYDAANWQPTSTFRQVKDTVRALAFHPDGALLAVGSGLPGRSGPVSLWDTTGAQKPKSYPEMGDTVESLSFRRDGKGFFVAADDNRACYYYDMVPKDVMTVDAHNGRVQAVTSSPKNGYIFITGAMDKIVKVWDEKTRTNVVNFDQSEGGITGLAFLNNGDQFVGSSTDGRLYWWGIYRDEKKNTYGGYHFRTVDAHTGGVFALGQSKDGNRFATGGADSRVIVWRTDDGGRIREFSDPGAPIYAVALTPDGKIAAGGGREGCVYIWDVEANKLLTILVPPALSGSPKAAPVKTASRR